MLNIDKINYIKSNFVIGKKNSAPAKNVFEGVPAEFKSYNAENLKAYHPSFSKNKSVDVQNEQINQISTFLDKESKAKLMKLSESGILSDNSADDGSTVLENLYKISTQPRIPGLDTSVILKEVLTALEKPTSITQKFGDLPNNVIDEIKAQTGEDVPEFAKNVTSSACVVASMEFNLASRKPAEFVRFAEGLTGSDYSVTKNIKMTDFSDGMASGLWMLKEFNTEYKLNKVAKDEVEVKIQPDRNAIIRARVQTSYKDKGERSCVDALIQSALLNLGSQHSYNSITDERTGKFNPDKTGLTDFEKNFVEQIIFKKPKISVVYQNLDENGYLIGYNCKPEETKQHILRSLELGENVIIGYTHIDSENKIDGGHEITITGYEQGSDGKNYFVCNDTDDNLDELIKIDEDKLLPLIHHAGISKEALSQDDVVVEPWREILDNFQQSVRN